jgi:hypothetical protein
MRGIGDAVAAGSARRDAKVRRLGVLAILAYAAHGANMAAHGFPENLLWTCHLGALLCGVGLLLAAPTWNLIGVLWLSIGTPLWLFNLWLGGSVVWTSLLTHLGGLAIGVVGSRELPPPRPAWWKALVLLLPLHWISRWVVPDGTNVNFANGTWGGFETHFPSDAAFLAAILAACGLTFFSVEALLRRALWGGPVSGSRA